MKNLELLLKEQKEFSDKTFGTPQERNEMGALHHLKLEIDELIENTNDTSEWADCLLLLIDGARRKGHTFSDLVDFALAKIEINKKRTWAKGENGVFLHVKDPLKEFKDSYDWVEAFSYSNGQNLDKNEDGFAFQLNDVETVLHYDEGQNDGPNWIIVVKLKNGLYGFLSAGCDYTGWDCQASGHSYVCNNLDKLIRFALGEDDRNRLGLGLKDDFYTDIKD